MAHHASSSPSRAAAGVAIALAVVHLSACSSPQQISYQQMMAPPNLAVAQVGDLAVVEFSGDAGSQLTRELATRLQGAQLDGTSLFRITGPARLDALGLQEVGRADQANAIAFARKVGARGVLFGDTAFKTDLGLEQPAVRRSCARHVENTCVQYKTSVYLCAEVTARLLVKPRVLGVAGGDALYLPEPRTFRKRDRVCRSFPAVNAFEAAELLKHEIRSTEITVRGDLIGQAAEAIFLDIAPYVKTFEVDFLKTADALQGEAAERFEEVAGLVDDGEIDAACSLWQDMALSGVRDLAVTYNLAACAEYRRDYIAALELYEAAYRQMDIAFQVDVQGNPAAAASADAHYYSLGDWADLLERSQQRLVELQYSREAMEQLAGTQ